MAFWLKLTTIPQSSALTITLRWYAGLRPWSKRVGTPVTILRSPLDKYHWESQEPPYFSNSWLNNIYHDWFSVRVALALNNPRKLICLYTKKPNQIIICSYLHFLCSCFLKFFAYSYMISTNILMACQIVKSYFMLGGLVIVTIKHSYLHFLRCCFLRDFFCTRSCRIRIFLKISIWHVDGTLTGTTTPGQSRARSNGNE